MGYTLHKARSTPLALLICMATLTACNTLPTAPTEGAWLSIHAPDAMDALSPALNSFLNEAPAGSSIALSDSPWGNDVLIHAEAAYFAASGRTCRGLVVQGEHGQRPALVCRKSEAEWEEVRVLTGPVGDITP